MFRCLFKRITLGALCALSFPAMAVSESAGTPWKSWLSNQISLHPEVIAAKEKMNSAFSLAEGRERPLYNPELETEFEQEGQADSYRIGINQTIDWWDKRSVRKQQASYSRAAAQQDFELTVQQKSAQSLQALVEWQAANQLAELARSQEVQLGTLLDLVKERHRVGDLGQLDTELAFLSLSQKFTETAKAQVQLKQAEARTHELLLDWTSAWPQIPESFWLAPHLNLETSEQIHQWVIQHPTVLAARAEWEALQQSTELARRETKPDPTFGINAGKSGEENLLALTFSIPLNVRNNFSAEARAASQTALSAEAQFQAIRRKQQFAIEASQATLHEYQQRFERWQNLMQGRVKSSGNLLKQQWRNGGMNTTEYLLALQQRAEGLIAGIELRKQFQLARIEWLFQTGQIKAALTPLTQYLYLEQTL